MKRGVAAILAAGCARPDCDQPNQYLADDGNCYELERSAGPDDFDGDGTPPEPWLTDHAVHAEVQDRFRRNRGTAAADFDQDGRVDLYLANPNDPATLLLNDSSGVFREQPTAPTTGNDAAAAAADFDNDGDPDLWVACGGWGVACRDALYRNDGIDPTSGWVQWVDVTVAAGLDDDPRQGFGVAWADFNKDGHLDVYISNKLDWSDGAASAANQLYRNNGDGTFTEVGVTAGVDLESDNHTATWLDVEPDGDLDLFVPTLFGRNVLYLNEGHEQFTEAGESQLGDPYQAFGSTAADINNDGLVDLVVTANSGSGWAPEDLGDEPMVFVNEGRGDFAGFGLSELLNVDLPVQMRVMGFALGDLNMDGFTDFFFGNGEPVTGGINRLLTTAAGPDGAVVLTDASRMIDREAPQDDSDEPYRDYPYRTHGTVMVDIDNDLDIDLYIGNGGMNQIPDKEEPNRLFVSSLSESSAAIAVTLEGTRSNRDGVGAMIWVYPADDGPPVSRWVTRSSGFNSSIPKTQTIGLGSRRGPFRVEVQWPTGQTQQVDDVAAGARLTIAED